MYVLSIIPLFFTVRRVGPRRICRLASDVFLVVYICNYIYVCDLAANPCLQVAVVCFCVYFVYVSCFGFVGSNEFNLIIPTTLT